MKKICVLHGAGQTPLAVKNFRDALGVESVAPQYDVNSPWPEILDVAVRAAEGCDAVVGHSFGGVVAWHVAAAVTSVRVGASVASPWGGSQVAELADYCTLGMMPNRFFSNISGSAAHLWAPRNQRTPVPWLNVVATRPGIFPYPENDGVLTVACQMALNLHCVSVKRLRYTHNEIMHSEEAADLVRGFLASR